MDSYGGARPKNKQIRMYSTHEEDLVPKSITSNRDSESKMSGLSSSEASSIAYTSSGANSNACDLQSSRVGLQSKQTGVPHPSAGSKTAQTGLRSSQTGLASLQTGSKSAKTGLQPSQSGLASLQTGSKSVKTGLQPSQTGMKSSKTGPPSTQTGLASVPTGVKSNKTGLQTSQTGLPSLQTGVRSETDLIPMQTSMTAISLNPDLLVIIQTPNTCSNFCNSRQWCGNGLNTIFRDIFTLENNSYMKSIEDNKQFCKTGNQSSYEKKGNHSVKEKWRQSGQVLKNYMSEILGIKGKNKMDMVDSPTKEDVTGNSHGKMTGPRSFLRYLCHKKDQVSRHLRNGKSKNYSNYDWSSSDHPNSSSDLSSAAAASDWSSENASANQYPSNNSVSNQIICNKCISSLGDRKNKNECSHSKRFCCSKSKKQCKNSNKNEKRSASTSKNCLKLNNTRSKKNEALGMDIHKNLTPWTESDSSEDSWGRNHSEIMSQRNSKNTRYRKTRNQSNRSSGSKNDAESYVSPSTLNVLSGLKHAVKHLPSKYLKQLNARTKSESRSIINRDKVSMSRGNVEREIINDDKANIRKTTLNGNLPSREIMSNANFQTRDTTQGNLSEKTINSRFESRDITHEELSETKDVIKGFLKSNTNVPSIAESCDSNIRDRTYNFMFRNDLESSSSSGQDLKPDFLLFGDKLDNLAHESEFKSTLENPFNVGIDSPPDSTTDLRSGFLDILRKADRLSLEDNSGHSENGLDYNIAIHSSDSDHLFSARNSDFIGLSDRESHPLQISSNQSETGSTCSVLPGCHGDRTQSIMTDFKSNNTLPDVSGCLGNSPQSTFTGCHGDRSESTLTGYHDERLQSTSSGYHGDSTQSTVNDYHGDSLLSSWTGYHNDSAESTWTGYSDVGIQSTLTGCHGDSSQPGLIGYGSEMLETDRNQRLDTDIDYSAFNDSFDQLLRDDSNISHSPFHEHLNGSRSRSSGLRSRSSEEVVEADDEYECDCDHCQYMLTRSNNDNESVAMATEDASSEGAGNSEALETGRNDAESFGSLFGRYNYFENVDLSDTTYRQYRSGILDIGLPFQPSIPLLFSGSPLGELLEDVIEHMLAARPELFHEDQYPPARQDVIDSLPTVALTPAHIEQTPTCPICLCLSEIDEVMTVLPCQHIFHPLCIQAWLNKSGTCPVCRRKIRN